MTGGAVEKTGRPSTWRDVRSSGVFALARTGLTQRQMADQLGGVSRVAICQWMTGVSRPAPGMRRRILEEFGIPVDAWDVVDPSPRQPAGPMVELAPGVVVEAAVEFLSAGPSVLPPSAAPGAPRPAARPPTVDELRAEGVEVEAADPAEGALGKARALERMASLLLRELEEDGSSTPLERARVMGELGRTLVQIGRLTGDLDLGRRMLKLPMWTRIEGAIRRALEPHPEAARAVGDALMALHEDREVR